MLARPHPIWGDWLHVQAGDMQRLMDRLLNFRDKALEVDPEHTGTPADFVQYCRISWLPANLSRPFYRAQAETAPRNFGSPYREPQQGHREDSGITVGSARCGCG